MKRTQLKRTAMKRKPQSKPRRTADDECRELRERSGRCWVCNRMMSPRSLQVHEIHGGSSREKCRADQRGRIVTCASCHDALHNRKLWPKARVYALKFLRDPTNFDRAWLNKVWGRSINAITAEEVAAEFVKLVEGQ
jgi:hypothetical protein